MKFNCGRTRQQRYDDVRKEIIEWRNRKKQWHPCFLWRPRRLEDNLCHWLEYAECKYEFLYTDEGPYGDRNDDLVGRYRKWFRTAQQEKSDGL